MAMAQQRSHLIELWAVILTTDESKIQACIHLDHSLCLDGAIPGVCYLLLATVSPKSGAIVVYQHHVSLVHRKLFGADAADAADKKVVQTWHC